MFVPLFYVNILKEMKNSTFPKRGINCCLKDIVKRFDQTSLSGKKLSLLIDIRHRTHVHHDYNYIITAYFTAELQLVSSPKISNKNPGR